MPAGQEAPSIWMRPERSAVGRPAQHSRAEITAVALGIADREGLDALSMRRVAADLGMGAASLYRYVETREDLLDLMTDAAGGEVMLPLPTGDWLADLVTLGERFRVVLRRHRWLAALVMTRPVIGPSGLAALQHVLEVLRSHSASLPIKLEAFAMLNGITASFVLHEQSDPALQLRNAAYLAHALTSGEHPRLATLLSAAPATPPSSGSPTIDPADHFPGILSRLLTGILGPA